MHFASDLVSDILALVFVWRFIVCSVTEYSTYDFKVDYVVTTYPTTLSNNPKIALARKLNLALVTELLVDRLTRYFLCVSILISS